MPVNIDYGVGAEVAAGASTSRSDEITAAAGATVFTKILRTQGMNTLRVYGYSGSGGTITVTPQFVVNMTTGVATPEPIFLDFPTSFILPPLTPRVIEFNIAAKFIRVKIAGDAALSTTANIVLSASQGGGGE